MLALDLADHFTISDLLRYLDGFPVAPWGAWRATLTEPGDSSNEYLVRLSPFSRLGNVGMFDAASEMSDGATKRFSNAVDAFPSRAVMSEITSPGGLDCEVIHPLSAWLPCQGLAATFASLVRCALCALHP